jgi:hypothetical protein
MTPLGAVRARLGALRAAVDTLGPILELDREWRTPGGDVERAKAVRVRIQEVLDGPPCVYDDASLELYRALGGLQDPAAARALVGAEERRLLVPAAIRSPWLALEEQSPERLTCGLVHLALALPDEDDYRDVMISLAPARVCADELEADSAAIFDEAAGYAGPGVAETFRGFGRRETGLGAFGWQEVETPFGRRFHLAL